jgi:uncharacterized membrane protein YjgN (DUF898 family)
MRQKIEFRGSSTCLFGDILVVALLSAITAGIYGPWGYVRIRRKVAENTYLGDQPMGFDGTGGQLWGIILKTMLFTIITLGIYDLLCYPLVNLIRWDTEHTILPNGQRPTYGGTALDLFGQVLVVGLLSAITLGIYSFWGYVRIRKHVLGHTLSGEIPWEFTGTGGQYFGVALVAGLLSAVTLGIYALLGAAYVRIIRWETASTGVPMAALAAATTAGPGDDRPIQVNVTVNR